MADPMAVSIKFSYMGYAASALLLLIPDVMKRIPAWQNICLEMPIRLDDVPRFSWRAEPSQYLKSQYRKGQFLSDPQVGISSPRRVMPWTPPHRVPVEKNSRWARRMAEGKVFGGAKQTGILNSANGGWVGVL